MYETSTKHILIIIKNKLITLVALSFKKRWLNSDKSIKELLRQRYALLAKIIKHNSETFLCNWGSLSTKE